MKTEELEKEDEERLSKENFGVRSIKWIESQLRGVVQEALTMGEEHMKEHVVDSQTSTVLKIYGELAKAGKLKLMTPEEIKAQQKEFKEGVSKAHEILAKKKASPDPK